MATVKTLKFTKKSIETLPYPKNDKKDKKRDVREKYRDSEIRGFFLRVGTDSKIFFVEKKVHGKAIKYTLGRFGQLTVEQAKIIAQALLGQMATGKDPNAQKRAARQGQVTLQKVFEDFLETRKAGQKPLSDKTIYDFTRIMETVFKSWKFKNITEINNDMVSRKHKSIGDKNGKPYSNLSMRFLRLLFNFAMGKYETMEGQSLIQKNPIKVLNETKAWFPVEARKTIIEADDRPAWW